MQPSHYLVSFPLPDSPADLLVYSTRKASRIILDRQTFAELCEGTVPEQFADDLLRLEMLVPDREQEKREYLDIMAAANAANRVLTVAVVLGLGCNFACPYCFQGTLKHDVWMTDRTADQLIAYINSWFIENKKKVIVDFYGGEPLLALNRIKYLTSRLKPMIKAKGGEFQFTLVTNGSLLNRKTAEELTALGLMGARVTIDGPPDVHNRMRPFKNGRPNFDLLLANLKECCGVTKIGLGGNYTAETFERFPELLDILGANGLGPEELASVRFDPILQVTHQYANPEFLDGCRSGTPPWLIEASLRLREEILRRGYRTSRLRPTFCEVEIDDAMSVNHDGVLYKCLAMIGYPEFACGDIWTGLTDFRETYRVGAWRDEPACKECTYLPLCLGGCRYATLQNEGNLEGTECKKAYYDATLGHLLLQDLKYRYPAVQGQRS